MANHYDIRPDDSTLALSLAQQALRQAERRQTNRPGSLYIPNGDGTGTLIGEQAGGQNGSNGIAVWVNDTTIPGKPTNVSCYSVFGTVVVTWGGTLEGGIPADFSHVSVYVDDTEAGQLTGEGNVVAWDMEEGAKVQVTVVAYDDAHDQFGNPMPNASEPYGPVEVTIVDERKQIDAEVEQINDRMDEMSGEADQLAQDLQDFRAKVADDVQAAADAAESAGERADAAQQAVDTLRSDVDESVQNVRDTVSNVQSDVAEALKKASDLAEDLDGTKATVEQVVTEQGEIKSSVSNAVEKADQSLKVSTQASQTATEARTTATSAYQDAQSALTQSSIASQTANAVKTELETKYSTTDEIAEQYATKSLVEQTSQSITSTVEATYATKATVEALENIANNAVQTWMGSGVPTLSNKPASDWTTAELKSQHSGDIYYDSDTGYSYRFGSSDGKNYSWSLIKDTDISKAVADAAKAQQTAEGVSDEVTQLKTDIPATYATKTEVKQTTDSIKSSVSEVATTANSALSKATTVEQTAKGLQTTVTEQAEKLDSAVTTISQVSQRVDSVSSTITQVSGRVDDVDAKADTAQGTANSALSQASRVEQSLDSFKTSVSRDYQTKTDALSQKSELEQNINSFKTTVSETYTTKDEFNALEIGGTNLLPNTGSSKGYGTSAGRSDLTVGTDDIRGEYYRRSTTGTSEVYISSNRTTGIDDGEYTVSFWYRVNQYVKDVDVYWLARSTTSTADHDTSGGAKTVVSGLNPTDNTWTYWSGTFTAISGKPNGYIRIDNNGSSTSGQTATLDITNLKLEKGNKPTAWSPAPEDFDGKYTSKTEFKQTTDKISATATAASQNASSALSKISSLEVSVDGINTKVEEVASDVDDAVKTTSQVSQRVDSLSSTITQVQGDVDSLNASVRLINPSFETGDTTGWKFFGYQQEPYVNNVAPRSGTYKLVFPSINAAGNISLENDAKFPVKAGEVYRISLSVNPDSAITSVSVGLKFSDDTTMNYNPQFSSGWHEYSGTVIIPSGKTEAHFRLGMNVGAGNNVRVDSVLIENVSDAKTANDTANSALSKSSSVEQNLNSFKTSVSQTYETKSDASSKQSSLQQSVNNLRTEVSETYTTKTEFNNLQVGGTNLLRLGAYGFHSAVTGTSYDKANDLYKFTVPANATTNNSWGVGLNTHKGKSYVSGGVPWQKYGILSFYIYVDHACSIKIDVNTQAWTGSAGGTGNDHDTNRSNSSLSIPANQWTQVWQRWQNANTNSSTGNPNKVDLYDCSTIGVLSTSSAINVQIKKLKFEVGTKPTDWSPCPADMLSADQAAQTYSTKSYVDQTARTVSLGVVEEYKNGQHGSALATQSDITATKNSITQTVSQTYLSKTDATNTYATKTQLTQTSDSLTVSISSAVSKAESAQNTANAAKKQTYNTVNASSGTAGYFRFATLKINATYTNQPIYFSLSNRGQKASNVWVQFNNTNSNDPTLNYIQADGGLNVWIHKTATSTWEMIAQKSEAYDVLYVNDYANHNNITVTWVNAFLSSVPSGSTQATRLASKRPSSDIDNAQSTANTANSNAQNAQNRVGNLETCIKMTSDGVRVGKVSNGNFTGYSALVNSAGSFDILNVSGTTIAKFSSSGFTFTGNLSMSGQIVTINNIPLLPSTVLDQKITAGIWTIEIQHYVYNIYRIRCSGTRSNGTKLNSAVITTGLPYSFQGINYVGIMHVSNDPVNSCFFTLTNKQLSISAPAYGGAVSYDGSMLVRRNDL